MPLYRCKIVLVPLAIIAAFFLWRHYLFATMSYRLDPRLTDVVETMHDIMLQSAEDRIVISDGKVEPVSLQGIVPEDVMLDIENADIDIDKAVFSRWCRESCVFRSAFGIDRPFEIGYWPYWYFVYISGGKPEAAIVPSLSDALENRGNLDPNLGYAFCEPQEQENWYLCTALPPS
ncbi:hypothetical protein GCM10008997_01210 [Halomonas salifodinae]